MVEAVEDVTVSHVELATEGTTETEEKEPVEEEKFATTTKKRDKPRNRETENTWNNLRCGHCGSAKGRSLINNDENS